LSKNKLSLIVGFTAFFLANIHSAQAQSISVSRQAAEQEIKRFAHDLAQQHQFDEKQVFNTLSKLQPRKDIIARISKPAESLPWYRYRKIWMKEKRIDQGVVFWKQHQETLTRAAETYGVDPAIIVAIIGVETFYGKQQGSFPVIEALHTLAFYYPKRATFFEKELTEYFLLARQQNWTLSQIKGSYAGAMGMGQFISSSYRRYAVDFNQDGQINLFSDPVDMIGSVANYFARHRWQNGGFVTSKIEPTKAQRALAQSELELAHTPASLAEFGVTTDAIAAASKRAGIFAFELDNQSEEYWLVGDNFYSITRYNHNAMYALAVYQLSEAIKARRSRR